MIKHKRLKTAARRLAVDRAIDLQLKSCRIPIYKITHLTL